MARRPAPAGVRPPRRTSRPRLTGLGGGLFCGATMFALACLDHLLFGGSATVYGVLFLPVCVLTALWVRECCAPATTPKDYASNDALWNAYDAWTLCAGRPTDRHTSIIPWGKTMTRLGYPAVNARRGHDYIKARKLMLTRSAPTRHEGPDPNLTVAAS